MQRVFKPAGEVTSAVFLQRSPLFTTVITGKKTPAQREGLKYEQRAQNYLLKLAEKRGGFNILLNPWLLYHNRSDGPSSANFCQPDCLLITPGKVIIVECKLSHTNDSYQQMRLLYEPVLRKIYPSSTKFALLEVCKWFDPHIGYQETFYYCENPLEAIEGRLGIHIFKPRGRTRKD